MVVVVATKGAVAEVAAATAEESAEAVKPPEPPPAKSQPSISPAQTERPKPSHHKKPSATRETP